MQPGELGPMAPRLFGGVITGVDKNSGAITGRAVVLALQSEDEKPLAFHPMDAEAARGLAMKLFEVADQLSSGGAGTTVMQ